jgi:hypothetical protein
MYSHTLRALVLPHLSLFYHYLNLLCGTSLLPYLCSSCLLLITKIGLSKTSVAIATYA